MIPKDALYTVSLDAQVLLCANAMGMHHLMRRMGYQLGQRQHERRQRGQVGAHGGRRRGKDVLRAQAQADHARGVLAPLDGPKRGAVRQQHARRVQQLVLGERAVPPPAGTSIRGWGSLTSPLTLTLAFWLSHAEAFRVCNCGNAACLACTLLPN